MQRGRWRSPLGLYVNGAKVAKTTHRGGVGEYVGMAVFAFSRRGGTDVRFDDFVASLLATP